MNGVISHLSKVQENLDYEIAQKKQALDKVNEEAAIAEAKLAKVQTQIRKLAEV